MKLASFGKHHERVASAHSAVTKTLPKHLVNRQLTSLATGAIIDQTGRWREDSQNSEAVCLETVIYTATPDGLVRSFSPCQVR